MSDILIPTKFAGISDMAARGRREGLWFAKTTSYYAIVIDGRVVGFCGILWRAEYATLKNVYIKPEFRMAGYGTMAFTARIQIVKATGRKAVRGLAIPASQKIYANLGFRAIGKTSNGIWMELSL